MLFRKSWFLLMLVTLVFLVLFPFFKARNQARLDQKIAHGQNMATEAFELYEQQKFEESIELHQEALSFNKLNPEIYVHLFYSNLALDNYQQAYESLISAINMEAISEDLFYQASMLQLRSGEYGRAIIILEHGRDYFPTEEWLLYQLGKLYFIQRQFDKADDIFLILAQELKNIDAYLYLGLSNYYKGDKYAAAEYYNRFFVKNGLLAEDSDLGVELLHQKILDQLGDIIVGERI